MSPWMLVSLRTVSERLPPPPDPCLTRAQCTGDRGQPQRAVMLQGDRGLAMRTRPPGPGILPHSYHLRGTFLPYLGLNSRFRSAVSWVPLCLSIPISPVPLPLPASHTRSPPLSPSGILQRLHSFSPPPLPLFCSACSFRYPAVCVCVRVHPCLSGSLGLHLSLSLCSCQLVSF